MLYRFYVTETQTVKCLYTVEASSKEEAIELAEKGDTFDEDPLNDGEVTNRQVTGEAPGDEG